MKSNYITSHFIVRIILTVLIVGGSTCVLAQDIEFSGGVTEILDYAVDGSVWIYDANVIMVEPAHISGYVETGSEAVLDIYGGQIDYLLMISMNDLELPNGVVTVYGTNFTVDGAPVDPDTTELFLQGQTLAGTYEDGTPFAYPVDCVIVGGGGFIYYQTVKLGWIVSQPDIELSPEEKILLVMETFDFLVQDGALWGVGNTKSAANKIETFAKMLATAGELIVGGYEDYALDVLLMIEAKCDGQKSPKDFIEGQGAIELNALINELIETLIEQSP